MSQKTISSEIIKIVCKAFGNFTEDTIGFTFRCPYDRVYLTTLETIPFPKFEKVLIEFYYV